MSKKKGNQNEVETNENGGLDVNPALPTGDNVNVPDTVDEIKTPKPVEAQQGEDLADGVEITKFLISNEDKPSEPLEEVTEVSQLDEALTAAILEFWYEATDEEKAIIAANPQGHDLIAGKSVSMAVVLQVVEKCEMEQQALARHLCVEYFKQNQDLFAGILQYPDGFTELQAQQATSDEPMLISVDNRQLIEWLQSEPELNEKLEAVAAEILANKQEVQPELAEDDTAANQCIAGNQCYFGIAKEPG